MWCRQLESGGTAPHFWSTSTRWNWVVISSVLIQTPHHCRQPGVHDSEWTTRQSSVISLHPEGLCEGQVAVLSCPTHSWPVTISHVSREDKAVQAIQLASSWCSSAQGNGNSEHETCTYQFGQSGCHYCRGLRRHLTEWDRRCYAACFSLWWIFTTSEQHLCISCFASLQIISVLLYLPPKFISRILLNLYKVCWFRVWILLPAGKQDIHRGSWQAVLPKSFSWSAQEGNTELLGCQVACLDITFTN